MAYYAYQVYILQPRLYSAQDIEEDSSSTSSTAELVRGCAKNENHNERSWSDEAHNSMKQLSQVLNRTWLEVREQSENVYNSCVEDTDMNEEFPIFYKTVVEKGGYGIGLDIANDGCYAVVVRFKELPPWVTNPARMCDPQIQVGDIIVGINDMRMSSFHHVVETVKELPKGSLTLELRRRE